MLKALPIALAFLAFARAARPRLRAVRSSRQTPLPREVIALTQRQTVDLLAKATGREPFRAEQIFDLRFQEAVVGLQGGEGHAHSDRR
jgi:hypothetical protein